MGTKPKGLAYWCRNPECGGKPKNTPDFCPDCNGNTTTAGASEVSTEPLLLFLMHAAIKLKGGAEITVPEDMVWKLPCGCELNGNNRTLKRARGGEALYHLGCGKVIDPVMLYR